jgi:cytochrome c peroxidase
MLAACAGPTPTPTPPPSTTVARMPAFAPEEVEALRSLWIGSLGVPPDDPSNRVAEDQAAAALGEAIFSDPQFSATGEVSCSTCHRPELAFTDGRARGLGIGETPRATMTVLGTAYAPWLFWDGRKDSLWAQALAPLENAAEHGGNRGMYAHVVAEHYATEYEAIFGPLPDLADERRFPASAGPVDDAAARQSWDAMSAADRDAVTGVFVNIGKAIAAFERGLIPGPSRFDRFVEALLADDDAGAALLTDGEVAGLRLFIGQVAGCTNCHNGPLLTNHSFHITGVPPLAGGDPDLGRGAGIRLVQADEFNCLSRWSDAIANECVALRFLRDDAEALAGAFKPPSLRNVEQTAPYMHAGQIPTLADVLRHYRTAPAAAAGQSELRPMPLTDGQLTELEAFLRTLTDTTLVR